MFTLDAGPLVRCQCPEGPATEHLDTGTPTSRIQPVSSSFTTTSSSGTPPAKMTTTAPLNSTYDTDGVPTFSSNNPHGWHSCDQLVFKPRLPQALPCLGYNPRYLVLLPRLPQALPAKGTKAAALKSTYDIGVFPPFCSTNPHCSPSCGHLLQPNFNVPSCFPTTSSSGTPTARLQPALSSFTTTSSSRTPRLRLQRPQP